MSAYSFGPLTLAYEGDLSALEGTRIEAFRGEGAAPQIRIRLERRELPAAPTGVPLYQSPGLQVYPVGEAWHARFSSPFPEGQREYAALDYDDCSAQLYIAPCCSNVPLCVESCTAFEHLALWADALPMHASHIQINRRAILFTAPSGVGKSTQAALWQQYRGAKIVNGDKALVFPKSEPVVASGLPYCGTSGICENAVAPLEAIVVLEQGRENRLTRLFGGKAVIRLMTGVICPGWHGKDREQALSLAIRLAEQVPVLLLQCLPEESAVLCLEKALQKMREGEKL